MAKAIISVMLAAVLLSAVVPAGEDYWAAAGGGGIMTSNDCGRINEIVGVPLIHRAVMGSDVKGLAVYGADHVYSGDILDVPAGAMLEWSSGNNIVVVLGPGSKLKLLGLRNIPIADGMRVARLDVQLIQGELRAQVRLNEERPEAILISIGGMDVLLARGDVRAAAGAAWQASVITGEAMVRQRRGDAYSAPVAAAAGHNIGAAGVASASPAEIAGMKRRLPFSFERVRAALPPMPATSVLQDAP